MMKLNKGNEENTIVEEYNKDNIIKEQNKFKISNKQKEYDIKKKVSDLRKNAQETIDKSGLIFSREVEKK